MIENYDSYNLNKNARIREIFGDMGAVAFRKFESEDSFGSALQTMSEEKYREFRANLTPESFKQIAGCDIAYLPGCGSEQERSDV